MVASRTTTCRPSVGLPMDTSNVYMTNPIVCPETNNISSFGMKAKDTPRQTEIHNRVYNQVAQSIHPKPPSYLGSRVFRNLNKGKDFSF